MFPFASGSTLLSGPVHHIGGRPGWSCREYLRLRTVLSDMVLNPLDALESEDGSPFEEDGTAGQSEESEAFQEAIERMSGETLLAFVLALAFAHVGLFATSLGLLLIYFRGLWTVGGGVVAVGLVALALTVWVYRWHEANGKDRARR